MAWHWRPTDEMARLFAAIPAFVTSAGRASGPVRTLIEKRLPDGCCGRRWLEVQNSSRGRGRRRGTASDAERQPNGTLSPSPASVPIVGQRAGGGGSGTFWTRSESSSASACASRVRGARDPTMTIA